MKQAILCSILLIVAAGAGAQYSGIFFTPGLAIGVSSQDRNSVTCSLPGFRHMATMTDDLLQ